MVRRGYLWFNGRVLRSHILTTAFNKRFEPENGFVALLGDENRLVKNGTRRITNPPAFEIGILIRSGIVVGLVPASG